MNLSIFEGAVLSGLTVTGANLRGAKFVWAGLVNLSLNRSNLRGAVSDGGSY